MRDDGGYYRHAGDFDGHPVTLEDGHRFGHLCWPGAFAVTTHTPGDEFTQAVFGDYEYCRAATRRFESNDHERVTE